MASNWSSQFLSRISLQTGERSGTTPSPSFEKAIESYEKELLIDALKNSKGNMAKAARLLKTTERNISYSVKKFRINPKEYRS